jgi:hypothetical protein
LPNTPEDKLALTFGGSRGLSEIALDQVRRKALPHKGVLPAAMLKIVDGQIQKVRAASVTG